MYMSGNIWSNGTTTGISLGARSAGNVIGVAIDLDNRKIWFRVAPSGNWNNSGTANPATNTGGIVHPTGTMVPFCTFGGVSGTAGTTFTANFGATAFSGAAPPGFTTGWTDPSSPSAGSTYTEFDGASSNVTLSNGNPTVTHPNTSAAGAASADVQYDGKFYFEVTTSVSVSSGNSFGVMSTSDGVIDSPATGGSTKAGVLMSSTSPVYMPVANNTGKNLGTQASGDVWAAAIDIHNGLAWFRKNGGNWNADASANPATGTGGVAFTPRSGYGPFVSFAGGANSTDVMTFNFGRTGFVGAPPSGFTGWPGV